MFRLMKHHFAVDPETMIRLLKTLSPELSKALRNLGFFSNFEGVLIWFLPGKGRVESCFDIRVHLRKVLELTAIRTWADSDLVLGPETVFQCRNSR